MLILNTRFLPFALSASCLLASGSASGQTPARPTVRRSPAGTAHKPAATAATPAPTCVAPPVLPASIPALPAGTTCIKTLYTLRFEAAQLDPQLSAPLRTSLAALNQSFSLNYVDTKIGTGELAQPQKYYTVNYTGYLTDGTKFDSSLDAGREPFTFPYGGHQVIQGWDTGFEGMRAGGRRRLFVPYQLAYGERGKPPIPAKATLIFDVEFLSQSDTPPAPKAPPAPPATPPGESTPPTTPPAGSTPPPAGAPPAGSPAPKPPAAATPQPQ